ncbi:LacI family DNA-binding transcriptional regulator [Vibrio sp. SCSIO 43132]|uniref:LacI family DNA-binding transcriptional regulator n=1 Tax=Vibrio sp. SCSIO 43132 TaxID=2779363 RepID=UPI001CA9B024|nr:LacI family DNA-binding transcriptional regulator [Vibrio sp. SCSIO 43132]UAB73533.1 LacI family DNA-binding transcriptional regulator [Vibrio sp. SCSIO 43132]
MTKSSSATISDVARKANLSKSAVSRYLNGNLNLAPETAERVNEAVKALNYKPSRLARRLSAGVSETIGLAVPDLSNPFFSELADSAEATASLHGYELTICITRSEPDREGLYIGWLDTRNIDGLLFITNRPDDGSLNTLIGERTNVVLLDEDVPGTGVIKIFSDNVKGGYLATQKLIELGHTDIAYVGGPETLMSVQERFEGYQNAMVEAGLTCHSSRIFYGEYSRSYGNQVADWIAALEKRPTAIFCGSDYIAIGVIESLKKYDIQVPDDISIIGFDDVNFAGLLTPSLSSIRQSAQVLGRLGVEALLGILKQTDLEASSSPTKLRRIPVELVIRDSIKSLS